VSDRSRFSLLAGWAVPCLALVLLAWLNVLRVRQVVHVSGLAQTGPVLTAAMDPGRNRLIVPEHNNDSFQWMLQTQQMLARREWRLRHIDYENAPFGRAVHEASPYRWWLGGIAVLDHRLNGTPLPRAVERAALVADPAMQALVIVVASLFAGWWFGGWGAAVVSLALATLFPFSAEYLGGAPDDHGLVQALLVAGCLPLVIGFHAWGRAGAVDGAAAARRARRWFFLAGMAGGLGMWVSIGTQVPVTISLALGAVLAAWWMRPGVAGEPVAGPGAGEWRAWALGGALAATIGYLAEFAPDHLGSWEMRAVHPLYALAWLGVGEIVARTVTWVQERRAPRSAGEILAVTLAVLAAGAPLVAIWRSHERGFLVTELSAFQLAKTAGNLGAVNLWAWLVKHGLDGAAGATLVALLLLVPAVWLLVRRRGTRLGGAALLVLLVPTAVALLQGCWQLSWWSRLDALLAGVLVATVAAAPGRLTRPAQVAWAVALLPAVVLGVLQLRAATGRMTNALGERELYSLIERDLADFLRLRAGPKPVIVLAPPDQTTALAFFGGIRGLGTLSWENQDGLAIGVRILSASTVEEAKELVDRRGVTHFVLPSWDAYMDEYARMGMGQLETTFLERLRYWKLPGWLRPIPYQLPGIPGFEGQSVTVLEVVDEQDDAPALSRIAEYFVEMGQQDLMANAGQSMRRFPADLGAVVARGQIELARGDAAALARTIAQIKPRLSSGGDRTMLWDRRVSLAVLLARAKLPDLAREQAKRCVTEATEERLRFLTSGSLYQLMILRKVYDLEFKDPKLEEVALGLLSPEARDRVAR
jgi:hypothetical protein